MGENIALLTELLGLVAERFQAALEAAIADIGRLNKVERMKMDVAKYVGSAWHASTIDGKFSEAETARAAIDGVRE